MWLYFIHPILTIAFHIERSKHPQNILRIFSLRCHISTMTTLVLLTSALFARSYQQLRLFRQKIYIFFNQWHEGCAEYSSKFINRIPFVRNPGFGLRQIGQKSGKWKWRHNLPAGCHCQIFVDVVVFPLTILYTGQSFTSIWLLYLKLWQFLFTRVLNGIPEIAKKLCLKFAQYLGTGTSKRHQIWHEMRLMVVT